LSEFFFTAIILKHKREESESNTFPGVFI